MKSTLQEQENIYILNEPTTVLHMSDISRVKEMMNRLADNGNSLTVIEHNLDVISDADWIINIGPEGGIAGGEVIFAGEPDEIISVKNSYKGKY